MSPLKVSLTTVACVMALSACSSTTPPSGPTSAPIPPTTATTAPATTAPGTTSPISSAPVSSGTAVPATVPATAAPSNKTVAPGPYTMNGGAGQGVFWVSPSGNLYCGIVTTGLAGCQSSWPTPNSSLPECNDPQGKAPMATIENDAVTLQCTSQGNFVSEKKVELPYGSAITASGVTCTSTQAGMACTNERGRGFVFSKDSIFKIG